jgi:uncharacterized membrane protein
MILGNIVFSGQNWLVPAILWLGLAVALLLFSYWRLNSPLRVKQICFALKLVGFTLLFLCLLEPLWTEKRAKPGANVLAILADNSQGMQIRDQGATESRGEDLLHLLVDEPAPWRDELDSQFQVRRYLFDTRLHGIKSFADLRFDGRASGLLSGLKSLTQRFEGQPLAGVLLFSDGNATDLTDGELDLSGLPPIYPVISGTDDRVRDISIRNVAISETAFEDAPVTITADVDVDGFDGAKVSAKLIPAMALGDSGAETDESENRRANAFELEEQIQEVKGDQTTLSYRFQFRPQSSGVSFYQLQVALNEPSESASDGNEAKGDLVEGEPDFSEATLANNQRVLVVDRSGGPYRILYVAGRPNWEYKFLNRALYEDDQVQLVGLIRVAKRAPKFEFKGRRGETSNPLFRGFDKQDDLTEQYDQPVLTRLNIRDENELVGGFPKRAEDLYEYTAIIVDDLEASFFSMDQMSLMQKYVSERGGGFLALGGYDSLIDGGYAETPVGAMLPVYLNRRENDEPLGRVRVNITREGMLEPWMRLRPTENQELERLDTMVSFSVVSKVGAPKPGATVLMTVTEEGTGEEHPGLAVQRYGKGKTAAMMIGDLWRWQMHDQAQSGEQGKAWRQLIRWLIADSPEQIEMAVDRVPADANQAVSISLRVKDKKFWPTENATVNLRVKSLTLENPREGVDSVMQQAVTLSTNVVQFVAEPSPNEVGLYEAVYIPRQTGGYAVEASVTDMNGLTVGSTEAGWTSDPASEEFRSLNPDRELMEQIARQTGGQVVKSEDLLSFVKSLPSRQVPVTEEFTSPMWHTGWLFALAIGCFVAEWGVRRTRGLA